MTTIHKSALVPYSSSQMFALVNDIDAYASFLPWCRSSRVLSRSEDEVRASIDIAHGGLHKSFTTLNRLQQDKMMEMRLVEGPFRHLEGYWRFDILGEQACKVSLDLDFEFSSRLVGLAMGPIFTQIANTLVDSFCKRAREVYGKQ
ncbi:MAG: ubiquinone-binding protein [Gammaproteobacteria bacterium HGW-Gammaproteobacteria-1]|nr:MAG: ubiquinone-binding protein [Gammaproteobacteria bacterium HGW-Gammaproteobacteria-1]